MQFVVSLPPGVILRRAERADAAGIRRLIQREHLNPMSLDWRHFTLAVDADGNWLGFAQIKLHGDGTRELASLVVVPAWRGRGLARALIRHFQAQAGPPLYLTCRAALEPLYTRFGFRSLGDVELPPYFLKLRRITNIFFRLAGHDNGMRIMRWDGNS
jgi:amino-acid N-acetyltransferase